MIFFKSPTITLYCGDALETLRGLPDKIAQCCVTSPPYWGLRDYGTAVWEGGDSGCQHTTVRRGHKTHEKQASQHGSSRDRVEGRCRLCGAVRTDPQIGLEPTPEEYVAKLVAVFREVWRVLRDDGTLWLNLGDSYAGGSGYTGNNPSCNSTLTTNSGRGPKAGDKYASGTRGTFITREHGLKPKDLVGIPWRVAFALQADGWYLRSDIIWCLSGGTWLYARTQKGVMPMMVRDMARLNSATVELWNGERWTQLLGMFRSQRQGNELELVLRSGERISCTPAHKFPTQRGLLQAVDIQVGDVIETVQLPDVDTPRDCAIDEDAAWFAGLYIAEGSRFKNAIWLAGHIKETVRWERVQRVAAKFGGSAYKFETGNSRNICVSGKVLNAILDELVSGRTAKDKCFASVVWRYSNAFIAAMVGGYLGGDGSWDAKNNRWRLGFCRNYNLERDLRTACARLGYKLTLNMAFVEYAGKRVPTFHGELRKTRSGHHNERCKSEVVAIRKARCREVYDLGVADEPHVFALASGVLTHNSKPNPMPESVTDRPTKAHEYLFLLAKNEQYIYDGGAVKEPHSRLPFGGNQGYAPSRKNPMQGIEQAQSDLRLGKGRMGNPEGGRNCRSVWSIPTQACPEAHFAVFPPELVKRCLLAGTKEGSIVLDPFAGRGTTLIVARGMGRKAIGIELNPSYCGLAKAHLVQQSIYDTEEVRA